MMAQFETGPKYRTTDGTKFSHARRTLCEAAHTRPGRSGLVAIGYRSQPRTDLRRMMAADDAQAPEPHVSSVSTAFSTARNLHVERRLDSDAATRRDRMRERVKIRLRLLGPRLTGRFVACVGRRAPRPLGISSQKGRALLAYLAMQPEHC